MRKVFNLSAIKDEQSLIRALKAVWKDGVKTGKANHQLSDSDIFQRYMPNFKKMMKDPKNGNPES